MFIKTLAALALALTQLDEASAVKLQRQAPKKTFLAEAATTATAKMSARVDAMTMATGEADAFDKDYMAVQNDMRQNPGKWVAAAEALLDTFIDGHDDLRLVDMGGAKVRMQTWEGKAAFLELVEELKTKKGTGALNWNAKAKDAACFHTAD